MCDLVCALIVLDEAALLKNGRGDGTPIFVALLLPAPMVLDGTVAGCSFASSTIFGAFFDIELFDICATEPSSCVPTGAIGKL